MTSSAPPRLAIIIVNFRTPQLTEDCLRSLAPEVAALPGTRVFVIDNGSGDDSAARIAAAIDENNWGDWAQLMTLPKNWGFAGGNNRALEAVRDAQHYLLLNSDTLVHPGCLKHCLGVVDSDPRIGVLSCKLVYDDGSMQNVARRFPTPARLVAGRLGLPWRFPKRWGWADTEDPGWDRDREARDVDWISGAFMWIRGDTLRQIGVLDEEFFFEGEDIEYCFRARRAGWRVRYDPGGCITHLAGRSSDPERMSKQTRNVHRWRARYVFLRKCHGSLAATLVRAVDIAWSGGRAAKMTILGRRRDAECEDMRFVCHMLCRPLKAEKS